MRKPVIAGNWKIYETVGDSIATVVALNLWSRTRITGSDVS